MSNKNKTKYEICKAKIMDSYMKKYEAGKLKSSNNKIVRNRLQAVAIGLSMSEKLCESKISSKDIEKMEEKVNKLFYGKNNKLDGDKLQLTNIKNAIFLINYYKKKKKTAKSKKIERLLLARCLLAAEDNNLTKSISKEIKNYIIKNIK